MAASTFWPCSRFGRLRRCRLYQQARPAFSRGQFEETHAVASGVHREADRLGEIAVAVGQHHHAVADLLVLAPGVHGELTGSRDTYVHFVQDPFDIASIVRPYVKWEYSLPSGVVVKEAWRAPAPLPIAIRPARST